MTGPEVRKPHNYDRLLPFVRKAWDVHDKTCQSLREFWLGAHGGVSCPSDLDDCRDCGHTFFNEGLRWVNYADNPDYWDSIYLCECCARRYVPGKTYGSEED